MNDLWTYIDVWAIASWLTHPFSLFILIGAICAVFIGYHTFRGYQIEKAQAAGVQPSTFEAVVSRAVIIVPGLIVAGFLLWLANFGVQF